MNNKPVLVRQFLGEVLREQRWERDLTLREVATRAGVSLGYLSEIERGRKDASSEILDPICTALNTPLSHVLETASRRAAEQETTAPPQPSTPTRLHLSSSHMAKGAHASRPRTRCR